MPTCVYFAYGSNLHPVRLGRRCPSATLLGTGVLPGWELTFHKRGRDGSAKGDASWTGHPGDRLRVAAFELSTADKARLDAVEGLGRGYREGVVRVRVAGVERTGSLYVAEAGAVDETLRPFTWYRAMVVAGAEYHGFPEPYLDRLRAVSPAPDPDVRRSAEQWPLLAEMVAANRARQLRWE
jgi:hypothetical protein